MENAPSASQDHQDALYQRQRETARGVFDQITNAPCSHDRLGLLSDCQSLPPVIFFDELLIPALKSSGVSIAWFDELCRAAAPVFAQSDRSHLKLFFNDAFVSTHSSRYGARGEDVLWQKMRRAVCACVMARPDYHWWSEGSDVLGRVLAKEVFTQTLSPQVGQVVFSSLMACQRWDYPSTRCTIALHAYAFAITRDLDFVSPLTLNHDKMAFHDRSVLQIHLRDKPDVVIDIPFGQIGPELHQFFHFPNPSHPLADRQAFYGDAFVRRSPDAASACLEHMSHAQKTSLMTDYFSNEPKHSPFGDAFVRACLELASLGACQKFVDFLTRHQEPIPSVLSARLSHAAITNAVEADSASGGDLDGSRALSKPSKM